MLQLLLTANDDCVAEFSDRKFARELGLSHQQVRTIHKNFISRGLIEVANTPPNTTGNTEVKKKKTTRKVNPDNLNSVARSIFEEKFEKLFGEQYYWAAKDSGNMTRLLKKISFRRESRGMGTSDEELQDALRSFLDFIKSDFVLENFTVSIINSQYNQIIANAGKKRTNGMMPGQILQREQTGAHAGKSEW